MTAHCAESSKKCEICEILSIFTLSRISLSKVSFSDLLENDHFTATLCDKKNTRPAMVPNFFLIGQIKKQNVRPLGLFKWFSITELCLKGPQSSPSKIMRAQFSDGELSCE